MTGREIKKGIISGRRLQPTILHESSADNAQNINFENVRQIKNDIRQINHKRMYNGSDGSSNAGRGSNH